MLYYLPNLLIFLVLLSFFIFILYMHDFLYQADWQYYLNFLLCLIAILFLYLFRTDFAIKSVILILFYTFSSFSNLIILNNYLRLWLFNSS
jgi:hypothetical protein